MIVFISCAKSKRNAPCRAADMYISPLFRKQLAFAEKLNAKRIYILSAKYGILELDRIISPYDLTLNDMSEMARKKWAFHCYQQLKRKDVDFNERAVFLAGQNYSKYLARLFKNAEMPLKNLPFGKRLRFLNECVK